MILPSESAEQKAVIRWWTIASAAWNIDERLLMACPAQAARSPRGGARIKAEGYRAGTPDLFLAVPRGQWHGLFVEMKRADGGEVSENQREMLFQVSSRGYQTAIAHGAAPARKIIAEYLAS